MAERNERALLIVVSVVFRRLLHLEGPDRIHRVARFRCSLRRYNQQEMYFMTDHTTEMAKSALRQVRPWRAGMPWWVILLEGLIALGSAFTS